MFAGWDDGSLLEAASWRLASELSRRHPTTTRLIRCHPGGGQYDCLALLSTTRDHGAVYLNRNGTIQVDQRFDGREPDWRPREWDAYFRADPRRFLLNLELAAGLPSPSAVPASTPRTLTHRILATMAATAIKTVHPVEIIPGWIDTSGEGGGAYREGFERFPSIPGNLLEPRDDDFHGQPGYRFWFVRRAEGPVCAFEQEQGLAWTSGAPDPIDLMHSYVAARRNVLTVTTELLRRGDHA